MRTVEHGDRFNPPQHDECDMCVGGFVPSDALIDALNGPGMDDDDSVALGVEVLRLLDGEGQ